MKQETKLIWWTKWIATWMAVGCALCSSLDLYPINVWLGFLAGIGWTWVGWKWGENALVTINISMTIVYGIGVIRYLLSDGVFV